MKKQKEQTKGKMLEDESDLTLLQEYENYSSIYPSWREMGFFTFMIILYYSNYARWLFWTILIMVGILFIREIASKLDYRDIIRKELKKRRFICK